MRSHLLVAKTPVHPPLTAARNVKHCNRQADDHSIETLRKRKKASVQTFKMDVIKALLPQVPGFLPKWMLFVSLLQTSHSELVLTYPSRSHSSQSETPSSATALSTSPAVSTTLIQRHQTKHHRSHLLSSLDFRPVPLVPGPSSLPLSASSPHTTSTTQVSTGWHFAPTWLHCRISRWSGRCMELLSGASLLPDHLLLRSPRLYGFCPRRSSTSVHKRGWKWEHSATGVTDRRYKSCAA